MGKGKQKSRDQDMAVTMNASRRQMAAEATAEALTILNSGRPGAGPEGVARLREAVVLGSGEAAAKLAHFAAAGLGQETDWDQSLNLLQQAADLGWAPAFAELRILVDGPDGPPATVRESIDISERTAARRPEIVREAPRIGVLRDFLSKNECAWLIAAARPRLTPAAIYSRETEGTEVARVRTNRAAYFGVLDLDVVLSVVRQRIANTIGSAVRYFEQPSVLHYEPGQQFKPHCDYLDERFPGPAADLRANGQRVLTFLVYLNEEFEGGETDFPLLDYRFKGSTGDAIVFANVDAYSRPDPKTRHAGLPPVSGQKWLLSQWVRDRAQV